MTMPGPPHPPPLRPPLGMPPGSVRALLSLMVMGLIWTLLLMPDEKAVKVPIYLYYLMFLVLGHYFAAHGHSIAGPDSGNASPLHLPRGTIRAVLILGFVGVLGWRYYITRDPVKMFRLQEPLLDQPYLPLVLIGAFFLGHLLSRLFGPLVAREGGAYWLQDMRSWLALLGAVGLGVEVLIQVVINPSVEAASRLNPHPWQMVLPAIICFYFGSRG